MPPASKKRSTEPISLTHPDLLEEWYYTKNNILGFDPHKLTHGSHKKVWWRCQTCSREWQSVLSSRSRGVGCPYCTSRIVCEDNCLANNDPNGICEEWHPTKNVYIKDDKKHNGFSNLNSPNLRVEVNLTPYDVTKKSRKQVWWLCKQGHEWQAVISSRAGNNRGCPYCCNQKVCDDNCLANNDKHGICEEWYYEKNVYLKQGLKIDLTPNDVTKSSDKKVWWQCNKCNGEWQATIHNRSNGTGCPYCSGLKAWEDNCLANNDPHGICEEWHWEKNVYFKQGLKTVLTPNDVNKGSTKIVWWKCKAKGHEWQAKIRSRTEGTSCPVCYNESRKK